MTNNQLDKLDRQLEALELMADDVAYPIEEDENYNLLTDMLRDAYNDEECGFDIHEWIAAFNEVKEAIKAW